MFNYLKNIYNEVKNERSTNVTENEKEKVHHALFNDLLILDGVDTYYQEASNAITNLIAGVQQFKNKKNNEHHPFPLEDIIPFIRGGFFFVGCRHRLNFFGNP